MLKLEYHVQLPAVQVGVFFRFLDGYAGSFAHSDQVKFGQNLLVHLLQIFMDMGAVAYVRRKISVQSVRHRAIRVCGIFGNHTDYIHTEAVHAFFAPPGHHVEDFLADGFIFPVQIRLLFGEAVEIIHSRLLVILPGRTAEAAAPVVGLLAVFGLFPDIIVPVRIVLGFAAFHKPAVLI